MTKLSQIFKGDVFLRCSVVVAEVYDGILRDWCSGEMFNYEMCVVCCLPAGVPLCRRVGNSFQRYDNRRVPTNDKEQRNRK